MGKPRLSPGKQRKSKKKIYGFDIETHGQKNEFLCAVIVGDNYKKKLRSRQACIDEFQNHKYRNSIIAMTNSGFDFFGVFGKNSPELMCFQTLFRGSHLLYAKTHLDDKSKFFLKQKGMKAKGTITFLDTLNYAQMSVKQMGEVLQKPKLEFHEKIGLIPQTEQEWKELWAYNERDAEISREFMVFLYRAFEELGATPKLTIASTSMSLFRNKYLKQSYYLQYEEDIIEIMKGYYGGRTEAFKRGKVHNINYYDVNSMYPHCMTKQLPDPNTHRVTRKNEINYIMNYEGMSNVDIICPSTMRIPYLPYRWNGKLVFPTGEFSGWYTHYELRKAINLGYTVKKIHKTHYYKATCTPLKEYATDTYKRRLTRKKTPMGMVDKLFMNSLYGKFGQRFRDREVYTPISNFSYEQIQELEEHEIIESFIKHKKDDKPSHFCIPIWAAYITAYARDMLYSYLISCDPVYCDTDSIMTASEIQTGDELGQMKLEMNIKDGVIIKPKMYGLIDAQDNKIVKIKGVRKIVMVSGVEVPLDYNVFMSLEDRNELTYKKFVKFKEAMRRGLDINELIDFVKVLDLEDTKRSWGGVFDWSNLQSSMPLIMIGGVESEYLKDQKKTAMQAYNESQRLETQKFLESDLFDSHAVGSDISEEEFLENEQFFARHDI